MLEYLLGNPDTVTAVGSLCVAVIALIFTAYQSSLSRSHNRLSVRPNLTIYQYEENNDGEYCLSLVMANNGLGPAIVNEYEVFCNGISLGNSKDATALIAKIDEKVEEFGLASSHERVVFHTGHSVPVNETNHLIKISSSSYNKDMLDVFDYFISEFTVRVVYESMYKEEYRVDTRRSRTA